MEYVGDFCQPAGKFSKAGVQEQKNEIQAVQLESKVSLNLLTGKSQAIEHAKQLCDIKSSESQRRYCLKEFEVTKILKYSKKPESRCIVFVAKSRHGEYALKQFPASSPGYLPHKELEFLRYLRHTQILPAYGAFSATHMYLVLELCYGTLNEFKGRMTDSEKFCASLQLMEGVAYIHSKQVVHANLNHRNLLISGSNRILISNFCDAIYLKKSDHCFMPKFIGSPAFTDLRALKEFRYSYQTDLHSCACIIFELDCNVYLQYVPDMEQTVANYIPVLENGYPTKTKNNDVSFQPLQKRILKSKYRDILKMFLNGTCEASSFGSCQIVLDNMTKNGFNSPRFHSMPTKKKFALQHSAEFLPLIPLREIDREHVTVHDHTNALFYYDSRDDVEESQPEFQISNLTLVDTCITKALLHSQAEAAMTYDAKMVHCAKGLIEKKLILWNSTEAENILTDYEGSNIKTGELQSSKQLMDPPVVRLDARETTGFSSQRCMRGATPPPKQRNAAASVFTEIRKH